MMDIIPFSIEKLHIITWYNIINTAIVIKQLGVFFDSKLYSYNYFDFMSSECIMLLGLICAINLRFSSLDCL
jgi:hypothetical protein